MKKRMLATVAALATGAGLAWGQGQAPAVADPAAVPIPGVPGAGGVTPVAGHEPLYLQGGPEDPYAAYRNWPYAGGDPGRGCPPHGCGKDGCGSGCNHGWFACGDGSAQIHKAAGGPDCFYFDLELLYLYGRSMPIAAPLISSGPIGSTGRPGIEDGVKVLFGDRNVDFGPQAAMRGTIGIWDKNRCWGMEAVGFLTEQRAEVNRWEGPITGRTVLARPNFNVLTGVQDSILVASPPNFGGSAGTYTNTRAGGAEFNFLRSWAYYDKFKFNTLAGFRWFSLNEQLRVDSHSVLTDQNPADPPVTDITDLFTTRNNFYGLNFGFQSEWRWNRVFVDQTFKVGVGFTHEKLETSGQTRFVNAGIETLVPFGASVLEPNSGSFSHKQFSFLPEYNLKLGYQWTQRLSTYIGYDVFYLSKVVRPGDQVNPNINPTLLPVSQVFNPQFPFGPAQPSMPFDKSDFWMQGFQFGMSLRY
ncbi:MAG: BBP7 family outer membrane beta-barrel protein [Gemmataceae bacterium]|nr:BBP7 family outer membrane beta-barrel protein [Gemmataceae bacterium]